MHYLIITVDDSLTANILATTIRDRYLALREHRIGDTEAVQFTVDTLIEHMDKITVLTKNEDEEE